MSRFKVGDRVVCHDARNWTRLLRARETYEVIGVHPEGTDIQVAGGHCWWFHVGRFSLAQEPPKPPAGISSHLRPSNDRFYPVWVA